MNAIIQRARKILEDGKAEREELIADVERRAAMEIPSVTPQRKHPTDEIIYKRHVTVRPLEDEPQRMSPETKDWVDWCNDRIESRILSFAQMIGTEFGKQDNLIKRLEDEIESLRAKLQHRKMKSSNDV